MFFSRSMNEMLQRYMEDRPDDPDAEMAERHSRMLREMADVGMEFVRDMQQAMAAVSIDEKLAAAPLVGPVVINMMRAVRQTVALEAKLSDRRRDRKEKAEAVQAERQAEAEAVAAYAQRGREIHRRKLVERVVEGAIGGRSDAENLLTDLYERLDEFERFENFMDQPVGVVAARISKSMGLEPEWHRWADEPWARVEAKSNHPESPFTGLVMESEGDEDEDSDDDDGTGPPDG